MVGVVLVFVVVVLVEVNPMTIWEHVSIDGESSGYHENRYIVNLFFNRGLTRKTQNPR